MTDEATRRLLEFLEREAREHPGRHRARIVFYAALGYTWLFLALLIVLAAIVAMILLARPVFAHGFGQSTIIYLGILFVLIVILGAQLQAFFLERPTIGYTELTRGSCPRLFQMIDDVRRPMDVQQQPLVYLTPYFNAGMSDLGGSILPGLGRARSCLFLGAPLLLCLSDTELRAVLAHELAHYQNRHCRFGAWVHRMFQRLENGYNVNRDSLNPLRLMGQRFMKWYIPFFATRTLPIRRIHEFDSDAASARLEGVPAAARTLLSIAWNSDRFERHFQPSILRMAISEEVPPVDFLRRAAAFFEAPSEPGAFEHWKESEIMARSRIDEEHPTLVERLEAIGAGKAYLDELDREPAPAEPTARSFNLIESEDGTLANQVNQVWRCGIMEGWRERRAYHAYLTAQIAAAGEKPEASTEVEPENESEWLLLDLELQGLGKDGLISRLTDFLEARSKHAPAAHRLGLVLLHYGDRRGVDWLERAMEWDHKRVAPGLETLQTFHRLRGDDYAADAVATRIEAHEQLLEKARRERGGTVAPEKLMAHDLDEKMVRSIRNLLALNPSVEVAWVARQQIEHQAEEKHYVVILEFRKNAYDRGGDYQKRIAQAIEANLPISCTVLLSGKVSGKLVNSMRAVTGEPIYRHKA